MLSEHHVSHPGQAPDPLPPPRKGMVLGMVLRQRVGGWMDECFLPATDKWSGDKKENHVSNKTQIHKSVR